jgi:DNA-binding IclR family transcriptional regulator
VHGLLQTLQAHGFVEQDRDSDKLLLGAGDRRSAGRFAAGIGL